MLASEVVSRARAQLGLGTKYELGRGGFYPLVPHAADSQNRCDCSGMVAYCLATSRHVDLPLYAEELGEWLSTRNIVRDARSPFGMFVEVPLDLAQPGMVYVWPPREGQPYGHCGIISEVAGGKPSKVVHCSSGAWRKGGDAITETGALMFEQHEAIVARCVHVEHDEAA